MILAFQEKSAASPKIALFPNSSALWPATNFLEERVVTKACTAFPVMLARHIIPHLPPQQKIFVKDRKKTQHVCVIFRKQPVTSSLHIKGSMCYTYNNSFPEPRGNRFYQCKNIPRLYFCLFDSVFCFR